MVKALLPLTLLAVTAAFASAQSTVDLKFNALGLGGNGKTSLDGAEINSGVGKLLFDATYGGATFPVTSVCGDITSALDGAKHTYGLSLTPNDGSGLARAGHIVATWFGAANTAEKAQGLQLAVWEALYDNGASFTADAGRFKIVSGFGDAASATSALGYAKAYYGATSGQALLAAIPGGQGGQSQLAPVPEPASLAALAVGGFGLLRRRRAKKG